MSNYVAFENGRLENGHVRWELSKDGQVIMVDDLSTIEKRLREIMMPGDTHQERYASTGKETRVWTFGDMVLEWELDDAFRNNDENFDELNEKNNARYRALKMVGK